MLHVVSVQSNPVRWASRPRLYLEFEKHMKESGVHLITVEHAFGERPFEVTQAGNPDHVQLRGGQNHELWLKESLCNIGFRRFPPDWKYGAWIDADVRFMRSDWATETVHALQHYSVVQPWSHSIDFGPSHEVITNEWGNDVDRSYCSAHAAGIFDSATNYGNKDWRSHFGYAWAIRREAYDAIGGLLDFLVMGSGDYHMALGFGGKLREDIAKHEGMTPGYTRRLMTFADRCDKHIRQNIGFVAGTLGHGWHGKKRQRGYLTRQDVIKASNFDPDVDLVYDWQGIPVLTGNNLILRDGCRTCFRKRNEDSIDVD
jgi:hypothetical protein